MGKRFEFLNKSLFKLLFLLSIWCLPCCIFSQQNISGNFQNTPLNEVIKQLESDHSIVFSYSQQIIENQFISAQFQNKNLQETLGLILENTSIEFEKVNETFIVLRLKSESPLPEISLCGKVSNSIGETLPFSNIFFPKTGQGVTADEEGNFNWKLQIEEMDLIEFSYVGYQKQSILAKDLIECPNIILTPQTFSFSEVIVKEYIVEGIEQAEELDHVILHPDQIDVVPGLTEADVLQMVEILPGIQSLDESAAGLFIRGTGPDQNLILWDGIPVYNGGHFFGMISGFNPFIVEDVKVFRGNFGAEYGGRVGGVIDISSEEHIPEKIKANIGLNFTNSDASLIVPLFKNKSALLLSARKSYTNVWDSPTFEGLSNQLFNRGRIGRNPSAVDDEELDLRLDFSFTDLNAKWWGQIGKKDEVSVSFFGIFDQFEYDYISLLDDTFETDDLSLKNLGWGAQWKHHWSPNFSSQSKITFTDFQNTYAYFFNEMGLEDDQFTYKNEVRDLTFGLNNQWQINPRNKLEFGYQLSDYLVSRDLFWIDDTFEYFENDQILQSVFLSLESKFHSKFLGSVGLRYNTYTGLKNDFFEPRFALHYLPDAHWQFKLSTGFYQQVISQLLEFNELGFNEQQWVMADEGEEVPVVKSQHFSLGVLYHRPKFQIEIEAYFKKLTGIATSSDPFLLDLSDGELLAGTGNIKGIDLLIKKRWNAYQTWLSYSWTKVLYAFDEFNDFETFPAPQDRPHSLNFVHLLNHKNWQFSLNWKYASGRTFTFADDFLEIDGEYVVFYEEEAINKNRLPHYHRLDASILYEIAPSEKDWKASIGLSFLNIYNRKNILSRQFGIDYEETDQGLEPFLQELDHLSLKFTPNLVLRLKI